MKVSFDGLRRNIAGSFNEMVRKLDGADLRESQMEAIENLRGSIGGLLSIYDSTADNDFHDLSDRVKLLHISDVYKGEGE